jgi:hypothetical protein
LLPEAGQMGIKALSGNLCSESSEKKLPNIHFRQGFPAHGEIP